jgi:hypothetical protein
MYTIFEIRRQGSTGLWSFGIKCERSVWLILKKTTKKGEKRNAGKREEEK